MADNLAVADALNVECRFRWHTLPASSPMANQLLRAAEPPSEFGAADAIDCLCRCVHGESLCSVDLKSKQIGYPGQTRHGVQFATILV